MAQVGMISITIYGISFDETIRLIQISMSRETYHSSFKFITQS